MEAGDGSAEQDLTEMDPSKETPTRRATITAWRNDWASFKRRFRAAGTLNGVKQAMKLGEALAAKGVIPIEDLKEEQREWSEGTLAQSERLAALLLLALDSTTGPQQSLVINRNTGMEDNGIAMWADLIRHFERGSKEIRMSTLQKEWEQSVLKVGEHPHELYGRLLATNSKLTELGVGHTREQLQMKFVAAIEGQDGDETYVNAIQQYRGTQLEGKGWSLESLLEFLTHIHETRKPATAITMEMRGLATRNVTCSYCKKTVSRYAYLDRGYVSKFFI